MSEEEKLWQVPGGSVYATESELREIHLRVQQDLWDECNQNPDFCENTGPRPEKWEDLEWN